MISLNGIKYIRYSKDYCTIKNHIPAPLFRRSFDVTCPVKSARLIISGLGFYEAHINGEDITKGYLAPYRSNHDHYVYFDVYDISDKLNPGKNTLGCILGNGMQNALGAYIWDFDKVPWRGAPMLAFRIEICYQDGTCLNIESDTEAKTHYSAITFDDLHYGEHYDARLKINGWDLPGLDDSGWKNAEPAPQPKGERKICEADPIVSRGQLKPVSVKKCSQGYIYDFGFNNAGICELKIKGKKGQKITLKFFEMLKDGEPYFDNIRFIREEIKPYESGGVTLYQENEYICSGEGTETHIPRFCYAGFRYVQVIGITDDQATKDLLTYILLSSKIETVGTFECDDKVINRLHEMTVRSDLSNYYYFMTDCPQREKNGWTGDASLSIEQMCLNFDSRNSIKEWLKNVYKAQDPEGKIPGIIPTGDWGYSGLNGPAWDSAFVNLPYYTYLYTGDFSVFDGIFEPLVKYLKYIDRGLNEKGLFETGLGDWCETGTTGGGCSTPYVFTNCVYCVDIARKGAFILDLLNKPGEAEYARSIQEKITASMRRELINLEDCTAIPLTQTSQATAIYYGIFSEDEKPRAVENLVKLIEKNDGFMKVGVLGSRAVFRVLAENGYIDTALNMITRPEFPSYGNWVLKGATTLYESFLPQTEKPDSLNHHFWGDISAFFYIYLAGIRVNPTAKDAAELNIQPVFTEKVNYVKATRITPKGTVTVCWNRTKDGIMLNTEIPDGIHGKIILPDRELPLKTGEYKV